jgi:hypothetical protein
MRESRNHLTNVVFTAKDRVVDPRGTRPVHVDLRRHTDGTAERPRRRA